MLLTGSRKPLALPPSPRPGAEPPKAAEMARYGAVELFDERCRAADRGFALTDDNAAQVAELCRCLDGLPLALEMAASRLPITGLAGLQAQLDQRLKILSTRSHRADRRRLTLGEIIDWSHDLLDPQLQILIRRLAAIRGSFSTGAAIAIAAEDGADPGDSLDLLYRLVDKSLVMVEGGQALRYRLLGTLRLHAAAKLKASG